MRIITLALLILHNFCFSLSAQRVYSLADTAVDNRLLKESTELFNRQQLDSAFAKVDMAQLIFEQVFGKESKEVADAMEKKGLTKLRQRKFDEALTSVEKALAIRLKLFGEIHPSVSQAYRNIGKVYAGQSLSSKAILAFQKHIEIIEKIKPVNELALGNAYASLANIYAATDELVKTCAYLEKAEAIYIKILGETDHTTIHTSLHLAKYYGDNAESGKAFIQVEKVKERIQKLDAAERLEHELGLYVQYVNIYMNRGDVDKGLYYITLYENAREKLGATESMAFSYMLFSEAYVEKGDYEKALGYAEKCLDLALKQPNVFRKIQAYSVLMKIYIAKEDYDNALFYCKTGLDSSKSLVGFNDSRVVDFSNTLAMLYRKKGQYDESIAISYKLLSKYRELHQRATFKEAEIYEYLGDAYYGKRMYDSALYAYKKGLIIYHEISSRNNTPKGDTEQKIVTVLEKQNDFAQAQTYLSNVLNAQHYYKGQNLDKVTSLPIVIDNLEVEAAMERRWYAATGDIKHLEESNETYNQAFDVLNYYNRLFNLDGVNISQKNKRYALYEGRIQTILLLKDSENIKKAFTINELNKGSSLQSQLKESSALEFANIPTTLLEREKDLRLIITSLEKAKQERINEGKNETDSISIALTVRADSLKILYTDLKKQFEKNYPDYYRLKYDLKTVSVADIQQKLLTKDQTMLSYFVGDSSIFAFVIKQDTFVVSEIKKDFPLESWIKQLRDGLYGYHTLPLDLQTEKLYEMKADSFATASFQLHNKLVGPLSNLLTKEVIIVPDGVLGYIPFDVLLVEKPKEATKFSKHKYLGNQHIINYNYSATLWQEMRQKKHKVEPKKPFVGFAPFYDGDTTILNNLFSYDLTMRKGLDSLKSSGEEVYKAQKMMGGESIMDKKATKETFEKIAGDYRIVHLATHGKANDKMGDYCFLVFTEQKDSLDNELLYVRDIYNLSLNADLVVLSACETGIGELKRGEGIVSLARAFAYAGAKSMVTTLWSVNDKSTMQIMEGFYRQLKKGKTKDHALWKAKQDYLEHAKDDMAHPYFWSAFIPIGDMSAVKK